MTGETMTLEDLRARMGRSRWAAWRRLRAIGAELVPDPDDGRRRLVRREDAERALGGEAA